MKEALHVTVSGIVQGVGFRYWTERVARELGLSGWVRNLDDGRVEALVEGERGVLDAFVERCKIGPRSANVTNVEVRSAKPTGATGFSVRADG